MNKLSLFLIFFLPFFASAQINESFLDGNFINNPNWTGTTSNFFVNSNLELQSKATTTSTSFLFTPSEAFDNASWECWLKIVYTPSVNNYINIYIIADKEDISSGFNGYYIQVGGTSKDICLYLQEGTKKTKIIDGLDKRVEKNPLIITVKADRDEQGNFQLWSKIDNENDFTLEGKVQNTAILKTSYFGLFYSNTSTTGSAYFFDNILVTGNKAVDLLPPTMTSFAIEQPNGLKLSFSEPIDFSKAIFSVDQQIGNPISQQISTDKTSISMLFERNFERAKIYNLTIEGLTDLSQNEIELKQKSFGIVERIEQGDIIINEIMFENAENSVEYVELYNKSEKLLNVSTLIFSTLKTDGAINTGISLPPQTVLLPQNYLVLCSDATKLAAYYSCDISTNIITTDWNTLNNEKATVVICNAAKDSIYDQLTYDVKWHHILVKNPKGVALERINPALITQDSKSWHSAASETNYGTPGKVNSQFRELNSPITEEKMVWIDPEAFSPDNDGVDDLCFIRYKTLSNGFVANVSIFNAVGVKIYQLASNYLLSTDGFLTWDGRTNSGKNTNVGIYLLCFEMINPKDGKILQIKTPIVVSSR